MLSDPQSVTIDAVAKSMPAIERGKFRSLYREATGDHELVISSTFSKRDRSAVKLTATSTAADPFSAETVEVSASVYLVMDRPKFGFTATEVDDLVQGLCTWLSTANVTAVIGGES